MSLTLLVRGTNVELDGTTNGYQAVRNALNRAKRMSMDYNLGNITAEEFLPFTEVSFKTATGGRGSFDIDDVIGVVEEPDEDDE